MSWQNKIKDTRNGLRNLNGAIFDATRAFGALSAVVKTRWNAGLQDQGIDRLGHMHRDPV